MTDLTCLKKSELIKLIEELTIVYEYQIHKILHERFADEAKRLREESLAITKDFANDTQSQRIAKYRRSGEVWEKSEVMQKKADAELKLAHSQIGDNRKVARRRSNGDKVE